MPHAMLRLLATPMMSAFLPSRSPTFTLLSSVLRTARQKFGQFGQRSLASAGGYTSSVLTQRTQLVIQVRSALDAQVVVLEVDPLVGGVRVLIGLAKAHEETWLAGSVGDRADERDRSSLAHEHGGPSERLGERSLGDLEHGMIRRGNVRPAAVKVLDRHSNARGGYFLEVLAYLHPDLFGLLICH